MDAEQALDDFEKALETDPSNWRTWHHLITYCNELGKFNRALRLPTELDAANSEAEIVNGVLTLTVPKAEVAKAKLVKVKAK